MASVRSTIDLVITGSTRGLAAASAEAEAMASRVESAEDKVSAARTRSAAAEDKVGVAEQRLSAARAQQEAALSRVGVAETNLEHVRQTSNESATRLSQAEGDLDRIRQSGSTQQIEAAEARVNRVRTESDAASRRLQQAEAQLATARANAAQAAARVGASEAEISRARSAAVRASEDAARAENDLNLLRRRGNRDTDQQRSGILGVFDAFSKLGDAITGADDASNRFLSTGSALQGIFSNIGGPIVQCVIGLIQFVAIMGAAGEIIGVVGGLIGQVLGGAPAILLALAAAAGTVMLGMDGIKKAAEVLQGPLDKLKSQVSAVFQADLTPVFRELAGVLPKLSDGFQIIAESISQVIGKLVAFIASARGIQDIQTILKGTGNLLLGLGDGLTKFVAGLLNAAAAAAPAMQALGTAIGDIFGKVGDVFTKLAGNGVIQAAVAGLAATIEGLANVIAPVVSLLIQMGAALGDSVGKALTDVGSGIEQVTPFFVKLADVAGKVLVDAFNQLGPPLRELVDSILPGAGQGLDGFASVMHNVVLPAVAGFINWLRTDGIPGFVAFTQGMIVSTTEAASSFLGFVSGALGALQSLAVGMAVFTGDSKFLKIAGDIAVAKGKVDELKGSIDSVHDKTVKLLAQTAGASAVDALTVSIDKIHDKFVHTVSTALGLKENDALTVAIDRVHDRFVKTLSSVFGTPENDSLTASIDRVHDQFKKTLSSVFGTPENDSLTAAIDRVHDKTTTTRTNVLGEGAVHSLASAIDALHDRIITVRTVFIGGLVKQFRKGGRVPTRDAFLVGEAGPELLTLDSLGGVVTNAQKTRQLLNGQAAPGGSGSPVALGGNAGDQPITVNVMLSQDQIAGIAQVEIQRRDRATKRTVLAGSGATF